MDVWHALVEIMNIATDRCRLSFQHWAQTCLGAIFHQYSKQPPSLRDAKYTTPNFRDTVLEEGVAQDTLFSVIIITQVKSEKYT